MNESLISVRNTRTGEVKHPPFFFEEMVGGMWEIQREQWPHADVLGEPSLSLVERVSQEQLLKLLRPIPVSERLPEDDQECLFFRTKGGWMAGAYYKNQWLESTSEDDWIYFPLTHATHWLPLLPIPE